MSLITLFDKSFIQSISVDESVWFDHFFLAVICPVFYVETLADLAKEPSARGPAESIVRRIAEKFPQMSGSPCMFHVEMCVNNLLGHHVPLNGQVPRPGGRMVERGIVFEQAREEVAFQRWQAGEFYDVERLSAAIWRRQLAELDLSEVPKLLRALGLDGKLCQTLEQARDMALSVVRGRDKPFDRLKFAIVLFGVHERLHGPIIAAWQQAGRQPIEAYAPYAAFVLTIEIFFQIALAANLIATNRASNRTDIAYLFYLPFCQAFVSTDKLHRRCAPLFLRPDQEFVWGNDLKAGLKAVNDHFLQLPENEREKGIMSFARFPPEGGFIGNLMDRHMRRGYRDDKPIELNEVQKAKLMAKFEELRTSRSVDVSDAPFPDEPEMLSVERRFRRKRGSCFQVPKDIPDRPE